MSSKFEVASSSTCSMPMHSDTEVSSICEGLVIAVKATMDPMSPHQMRMEAFTHCENFKEQSSPELSLRCALLLCANKNELMIRHFGLKLLEDVIKLKWNSMPHQQKVFVKDNVMMLMHTGVSDMLLEASHIKDGISRLVVEIIKREYPQQWPNLWAELEALSSKGEAQTELVMLVMLRMVEDVAVLQTLEQHQRRKEIYQALTAQMENIFQFLLTLLERHYKAYVAEFDKTRHAKVCQSVLLTFNAFVEWVPMSHIMANNCYLIRCLCHLLSDEIMQLRAAECLLSTVSWKGGKLQDHAQLLVLFKSDMMAPLFEAVEAAERKSLDEKHYLFLKKMVQILVELGGQLCHVWSSSTNNEFKMPPENFDKYLDALLAFTRHSSQMVNYYANELWAKLARQADVSRDDTFRSFLPKWVMVATKKALKVGHPSRDDHPSCNYSRLDFESDEEFLTFFGRYRIILLEVIRLISAISPVVPYQFTDHWLRSVLSEPVNFGKGQEACSVSSPTYLELEAISQILDAILSKSNISLNELQPLLPSSVSLLKLCLDYQTCDPILKSVLLSCISSLFVVVTLTPAALMPTVNKILESITFTSGSGAALGSMTQEVKLLRRHGCALLVKVAYRYPKCLTAVFEYLRATIVDDLHLRLQALHNMEYVTLVEALVLVSNQFASYQAQSAFIKTIAEPVYQKFQTLQPILADANLLINFIGLSSVAGGGCASNSSSEAGLHPSDHFQKNRSALAFYLQFLLSVSRRSQCPVNDLTKCRQGGFVLEDAELAGQASVLALRNPAGQVGCAMLSLILTYAKTLNELWSPTVYSKIPADMAPALGLLDIERKTLIGTASSSSSTSREDGDHTAADKSAPDADFTAAGGGGGGGEEASPVSCGSKKTEAQKLQTFLFEQYEAVYHLLSQYCIAFGHEFYRQPNLASALCSTALFGLQHIPDYRLRALVRTFLKSFVNKCPRKYFGQVLLPLLQLILPYMFQRLNERWSRTMALRESPNFDENNTDSQEVLDDVLCRQLTREYLDVIKASLTSGGGSDLKHDDSKLCASTENLSKSEGSGCYGLALSELGKLVLQDDGLGQYVLATLLEALVWPDTPTSVRACQLLEVSLPVVGSSEKLNTEQAKRIIFIVLRVLHTMGQHEANYIALVPLAIQAYEMLRARHPAIMDILVQVPGCNVDDVQRFDLHVLQVIQGKENGAKAGTAGAGNGLGMAHLKCNDRTLKNMFKKITSNLIGKDVAQMFKKDVVIKNLPSLQIVKQPRNKMASVDDSLDTQDIGLTALFVQNSSSTSLFL